MFVLDVIVVEIEILSVVEMKKLVWEVYVFVEGVNIMFFEVRKKVRYLCELVDYLDKVWRSCKIVLILIVCGCMIVVGEVVIVMIVGVVLLFLIVGIVLVFVLIWV